MKTHIPLSTLLAAGALLLAQPSMAAGHASAASAPASGAASLPKNAKPPAPVVLVDINSASIATLKTLPGIGDAEAARIVKGRPYLSKADLVSKEILPAGVYLSLKGKIVAGPIPRAKGKP